MWAYLVPLPFYWTTLRRVRVVLISEGSREGGRVIRLPVDLWGYLIASCIAVLIGGYVFLSETLQLSEESEVRDLQGQSTQLKAPKDSRRLTQQQKTSLINRLRGRSEGRLITITTLANTATEARQYAEDFIEVFTAAGWNIQKELPEGLSAAPVLVFFQSDDHVAAFLLDQLEGVNVQVKSYPAQYSDTIKFIIGPQQE